MESGGVDLDTVKRHKLDTKLLLQTEEDDDLHWSVRNGTKPGLLTGP
jgi:hypothetical protein